MFVSKYEAIWMKPNKRTLQSPSTYIGLDVPCRPPDSLYPGFRNGLNEIICWDCLVMLILLTSVILTRWLLLIIRKLPHILCTKFTHTTSSASDTKSIVNTRWSYFYSSILPPVSDGVVLRDITDQDHQSGAVSPLPPPSKNNNSKKKEHK